MDQLNQKLTEEQAQAVLKPILYADIFDYPLTLEEVYKFVEFETTLEKIELLLGQAVDVGQLVKVNGFYSLSNRSHLAAKRQERKKASRVLWPRAIYYGRWLASLPFVRLVAITGALAVDNPSDGIDDIDYLIVTQPRRLWLCRAMIIMLVKYGHRRGVHLCPNYLITENVLDFEDDFFAAREMMQMQPLYGTDVYLSMSDANTWVTRYFPQGDSPKLDKLSDRLSPEQQFIKRVGESILRGFVGNILEFSLQKIQVTKHTKRAKRYGALDKVIFTADVCKGHYDGHNHKTMVAYQQRIKDYLVKDDLLQTNGRLRTFGLRKKDLKK